ncbi:DUF309 domain-containing protein [Rhodophyticola sp. SM2404]
MSAQSPLSWRPPHAYVPGQSPRHDEELFDHLKDVDAATPAEGLARSQAYAAGLVFLREAYFWEAHEMLEPVWMACPPNSAERVFVQALVQLANAGLKTRMQRPQAAARLYAQADALFEDALRRADGAVLEMSQGDLRELVAHVHLIANDSVEN